MQKRQTNQSALNNIEIFSAGNADCPATWNLQSGRLPRLLDCSARMVWRYAGEVPWRDKLLPLPGITARSSFSFNLSDRFAEIKFSGNRVADNAWQFGGRITNTGKRPV